MNNLSVKGLIVVIIILNVHVDFDVRYNHVLPFFKKNTSRLYKYIIYI